MKQDIKQNIESIKNELPKSTRLIAVSKKKSIEDIQQAYQSGQRDFAENYAQEFLEKSQGLSELEIDWHFIGHLQTNKAKFIVGQAGWIHTLDRVKLAKSIEKECQKLGVEQKCLIQIKVSQDLDKTGCPLDELDDLIEHIKKSCPHILVKGLMAVASLTENENQIRDEFLLASKTLEKINIEKHFPYELTELSLGMSHDYPLAIEAGSTMIRVGSKIFGERI